jgi:hypothetical protein
VGLPHADAVGYYRWQLPQAQFVTLASNATTGLTPGERIAFLGNLGALLDASVIHGDAYLDVLNRFSSETDPDVLGSLLSALNRVEGALTERDRPLYAAYLRRTIGPVLERVGYQPKPGESQPLTNLRPRLLTLLANVGKDPAAIAFAKEQSAKYMQDPASVHPTLVSSVLGISAFNGGDEAMFDEYRKRFEAATIPAERNRYLGVLGALRGDKVRDEAFAYVLGDKLRPNEIFTIPFSHFDTEEERAFTFEWILKNFDALAKRIPPQFLGGMPGIAGGCDESRLARTREFFSGERKIEGMERSMARTEEQVKECVAFRAREADTIRTYLAK